MRRLTKTTIIEQLIAAGKRLDDLRLVPARDGNISARLSADRLLVTATGVRKRLLTPEDFVELDLSGKTISSQGKPSTEIGLHLCVYRERPDVQSIMHAHPPTAVGFASAGRGLTECLMPEVAVNLGAVPLTPYATPGTPALEEAILPAVRNYDAFLLANHGAVTMGNTVDQALERMETLEHFAKITLVTHLLGGATALNPSDVQSLEAIRARVNPRPVNCDPAAPISPGLPPTEKPSDISEAQITETVTRVVRQILGDTKS